MCRVAGIRRDLGEFPAGLTHIGPWWQVLSLQNYSAHAEMSSLARRSRRENSTLN
jgi:hypothetical protein